MAPDRHVARVRRKTAGYHNRRFKGKRSAPDRNKAFAEAVNHRLNQLPVRVRWLLEDVRHSNCPRPLFGLLLDMLFLVDANDISTFWFTEGSLFIVLHTSTFCLCMEDGSMKGIWVGPKKMDERVFRNSSSCLSWVEDLLLLSEK